MVRVAWPGDWFFWFLYLYYYFQYFWGMCLVERMQCSFLLFSHQYLINLDYWSFDNDCPCSSTAKGHPSFFRNQINIERWLKFVFLHHSSMDSSHNGMSSTKGVCRHMCVCALLCRSMYVVNLWSQFVQMPFELNNYLKIFVNYNAMLSLSQGTCLICEKTLTQGCLLYVNVGNAV